MKTRIATDLGDPIWIKLLKAESQACDLSMKEVLIRALEYYFAHRFEMNALARVSESVFSEWDNPLDADYDKL